MKPKRKIFFVLNEPSRVSKILDANEPEPLENMSIEKQQFIIQWINIFIYCCDG